MNNDIILEINKLWQYFRNSKDSTKDSYIPLLRDINFDVKVGEVFGIVGESGCGKTTLGKCLVGLFNACTGEIKYRDLNIIGKLNKELKEFRKNVQIIFQNPRSALNMNMQIRELIYEAVELHDKNCNINQRVDDVLRLVKLVEKKDSYPHQLSGGERRRAQIGRVLAISPKLIIADEPVASLDVSYRGLILEILLKYKKANNASMILISHDIQLINSICDRVAVMFKGRLVEIIDNPNNFSIDKSHHPYVKELYSAANYFKKKECGIEEIFKDIRKDTNKDIESFEYSGDGCPYFYRCGYVNDNNTSLISKCKSTFPELVQIKNNKIACHYLQKK